MLSGSFTGVGTSETLLIGRSDFNISLYGAFEATVLVERSFDNGTTWQIAKSMTDPFEGVGKEVEPKVLYRFRCSSFVTGEAFYRLGTTRW